MNAFGKIKGKISAIVHDPMVILTAKLTVLYVAAAAVTAVSMACIDYGVGKLNERLNPGTGETVDAVVIETTSEVV